LETVFSLGASPRLYNEELRHLREWRESLEAAVEGDGEEET
jgi:hypothetical protein